MKTNDRATMRLWPTLLVVSLVQMMIVLDATIVNIALPSAQRDLHMSDGSRQWVITAYALTFGGLLLLCGRISGSIGHRRTFIVGLIGFAAASALGGFATAAPVLFAARAAQGVCAACLAPAALSLLSIAYADATAAVRGQAFGVFAAVGAGGSALGLVVGGLLTRYLDWRWCLFVNVPIALCALIGSLVLRRDQPAGRLAHLDFPGALVSIASVTSVVFGLDQAQSRGWSDPLVLALLCVGAALVPLFVAVESRVPNPLLPMRILADRARSSAFATIWLMQVALFGFYLFMTYYTQTLLGYSPLRSGLTLVVITVASAVGSTLIAGRLLARVSIAALVVPGLVTTALGLLILVRLTPGASNVFLLYLLPSQILIGLGIGCVMTATTSAATAGTRSDDTGTASAMYNATQQVGGALGTALYNTVATGVTASYLAGHTVMDAAAQGYSIALLMDIGILVVAAGLAQILRAPHRTRVTDDQRPRITTVS
ncbi:MFS transporter [Nocardia sp. NPDC051052]|uniref:MFS transporter n=1 Tax=Nocardia sp. NPDC051052 TaxID=3364322 RepID=UPI0037B02DA6